MKDTDFSTLPSRRLGSAGKRAMKCSRPLPAAHQHSRPVISAAVAVAMLMMGHAPHARAAGTLYWDGTEVAPASADGGSGVWDASTSNWDDSLSGGANSPWSNDGATTAYFAGAAGTVTLSGGLSAQGFLFTKPGYQLTGPDLLTLGSGGIDLINVISGAATINNTLALGSSQTWWVGQSNSGGVDTTLNFGGVATLGAGQALTRRGAGTLNLSGGSAGTPSSIAAVELYGGITNITGFLNTPEGFDILSGGAVNFSGVTTSAGNYTGIGDGAGGGSMTMSGGAFNSNATQATFIGNSGTGSLTITGGTFSVGANTLVGLGNGFQNNGSGTGTLTLSGTGTFTTGLTAGSFILGSANGTAGSGTINLNSGGTLATNRSLTRGVGNATAVINYNGGTFRAAGTTAAISNLITGNVRGNSGTANSGAVFDSNGHDITIAQHLFHSITPGDPAVDGGVTKTGAGRLILTETNNYTGVTTVNGGILQVSGSIYNGGASAGALVVNNTGELAFARSDTFGSDTTGTPVTLTINAGGLVTSNGFYTTLPSVTLNGGTLRANGGVSTMYPAYQLRNVVAGGAGASQITATGAANSSIALGQNANDMVPFVVANSTGDASADLIVSAPLQNSANGSSGLTKSGAGTMALTAANTYTGATTISAGTLQVTGGGTVSSAGTVSVETGGALTVTGIWNNNTLAAGNTGAGTLTIQAAGTMTTNSGFIGNGGGSTGTATVTGANSKWTNNSLAIGQAGTGSLNILAGGLVATGGSGAIVGFNALSSGTVTVDGANSRWTNTGALYMGNSGAGVMNVQNGGAVTNAITAFVGAFGTSIATVTVSGTGSSWTSSGGLTVGDAGTGTLTLHSGGAASVTSAGGILTLGGQSGGSGTLNIGAFAGGTTAGILTATTITSGAGAAVLNFNQTDSINFAPDIRGSVTINQRGSGTTTFTGARVYSGAAMVSGGNLIINGAVPNSAVTISGGAASTLGGAGVTGAVTIGGTGGTIAPGARDGAGDSLIGTLNTGNLSAAGANSHLSFQLGAGQTSDSISVTGTIDITGADLIASFAPGFTANVGDIYALLINDGAEPMTGNFSSFNGSPIINNMVSINGFPFQLTYQANYEAPSVPPSFSAFGGGGGIFSDITVSGGNDLALISLAVVPEPSRAVLILLAGAGILGTRRRRLGK